MKGVRLSAISALFAVATIGVTQAASPDATLPGPFGPPSWDTQYPAKQRFLILTQFNNEAVLDRETGLVWQRAAANTTASWVGALSSCRLATTGDRKGWRLPSYEEMSTLIEPKQSDPDLPANNPFQNFNVTSVFWTASVDETDSTFAYVMVFNSANSISSSVKSHTYRYWCVRGGQGTQNPF